MNSRLESKSFQNQKCVVVTGVSSGIGRALANELVRRGFVVFGTVRSSQTGLDIRSELGDDFHPLLLDITNEAEVAAAATHVGRFLSGNPLFGLVNNAGAGGGGPLMHLCSEDLRSSYENLVVGPMNIIRAFLPHLGANKEFRGIAGRIINISSVAGRIGFPFLGPYIAGKHALEGVSDCLRRELLLYGIDVVVIQPGPTKTAIWEKARSPSNPAFSDTDYANIYSEFTDIFSSEGERGYNPSVVAEVIIRALTVGSPKARYAVMPRKLVNWTLFRHLPDRIVDWLFAQKFGLTRVNKDGL